MRLVLGLQILLAASLSVNCSAEVGQPRRGVLAASAQVTTDRATDETAIRYVAQEFIARRERGDADGLRALLTETVDQRISSGGIRAGRDAVVSGSLATSRATGGRRSITFEAIRFLGDDVAIADGPYRSVGRNDGTDLHMHTTFVLRRLDGEWKIEAIRNVRLTE